MLSIEEKKFFAGTAWGTSNLSICTKKVGAVLARGPKLLSCGHNRRILKDTDWEISAIYDAIFSARDIDLSNCVLFSTDFPCKDDFKLIIATGIATVYFFGAHDPKMIPLINGLSKEGIPLELIHLKS